MDFPVAVVNNRIGSGFVMLPVFVMIWGAVAAFGVSAVAALVWAVRRGQFDDPAYAARSIFFDDEPVGVGRDEFPKRDQREKA